MSVSEPPNMSLSNVKISISFKCIHFLTGFLQEEGEDEGRMLRMGKRLLRSLALVFGCIALASLVGFSVRVIYSDCPINYGVYR